MPELPEVETTVKGLRERTVGLTIRGVWSDWEKMVKNVSFRTFKNRVVGRTITGVDRRGKNILVKLDDGGTIRIHMKMTGHLLFGNYQKKWVDGGSTWVPVDDGPLKDPFNRFIHFVFTLRDKNNNDKHLAFCDMRKFGRIEILSENELANHDDLNSLGPEILEGLTQDEFVARVKSRPKSKIKQVLMDQAVLAGIGNIYADEILWDTDVHPLTAVKDIPETHLSSMYHSSKRLLSEGVELGGDSMSDYRNIDGEKGQFQGKHKAYQKEGERCEREGCDGVIDRLVVGARSAHFCKKHQVNFSDPESIAIPDPKVEEQPNSKIVETKPMASSHKALIIVVVLALVIVFAAVKSRGDDASLVVDGELVVATEDTTEPSHENISFISHSLDKSNPNEELLVVELKTEGGDRFSISDWTLFSSLAETSSKIGGGVSLFRQGEVNSTNAINITKSSNLVISSGHSPVGVSFRENICSGYLGEVQQFVPPLEKDCPVLDEDYLVSIPGGAELDDSCVSYITSIPRCGLAYENFPNNLTDSCKSFITENINYTSCIEREKGVAGFFKDQWRIYLGSDEALWPDEGDLIKLKDRDGKTLETISY